MGAVGKRVGELVHVAADVVDAHVHDVGQTLAASSEPCGDLVPDGGVTDVLDLHRRTGIGFLESLRGGFERFARLLPRPDGDGATDLCRFLRVWSLPSLSISSKMITGLEDSAFIKLLMIRPGMAPI